MKLEEGQKAPAFTLPAGDSEISLKDYAGQKNVVLYFYPKDDTPGCTIEACGFRDSMSKLESVDTAVLGVSKDDLPSHEKFIKKFELNFPLLADTDGKVCEAYGCWVEKNMYGKKRMGIQRSTFLIDKEGVIQKIWPKVKPDGHADEVLEAISQLPA